MREDRPNYKVQSHREFWLEHKFWFNTIRLANILLSLTFCAASITLQLKCHEKCQIRQALTILVFLHLYNCLRLVSLIVSLNLKQKFSFIRMCFVNCYSCLSLVVIVYLHVVLFTNLAGIS